MSLKTRIAACFLFILLLFVAACSDAVPVLEKNPGKPGTTDTKPLTEQPPAKETMRITVYHATKDAMHLVPEVHIVDKNDNPAKTAIALLAAEPTDKSLMRVLPGNTRLLSLKIKDNIAYANFNQQLAKNVGGSATEILLVGAIVNTLTEFPEIKAVQILIDGKKVDTISGHMDVSEPLSRSEGIIKRPK